MDRSFFSYSTKPSCIIAEAFVEKCIKLRLAQGVRKEYYIIIIIILQVFTWQKFLKIGIIEKKKILLIPFYNIHIKYIIVYFIYCTILI